MTPDEREAALTAYALNDPGLTPEWKAEVEARLASDPDAARQVDEIRALAGHLSAAFAAEVAATPAPAVTIPAAPLKMGPAPWVKWAGGLLAASVLVGAFTLGTMGGPQRTRFTQVSSTIRSDRPADGEAAQLGDKRTRGVNEPRADLANPDVGLATAPPANQPAPGEPGDVAGLPMPAAPGKPQGQLSAERFGTAKPGALNAGGPNAPTAGAPVTSYHDAMVPGTPTPPTPGLIAGIKAATAPRPTLGYAAPPPPPPAASPAPIADPVAADGKDRDKAKADPAAVRQLERLVQLNKEMAEKRAGSNRELRELEDRLSELKGEVDARKKESRSEPEVLAKQAEPAERFALVPAPAPGQTPADALGRYRRQPDPRQSRDAFPPTVENPFTPVEGQQALSTFGVDVDTASYAIARKYLTTGQLPPADAVRLEEVVNYFRYQDKAPTGDDPFAVTVELGQCPWQPRHQLARIGLKARPIDTDKRPPSNLVFLVDVSGSMNEPNKLPLVKQSLKLLVNQLGENDRVAMVVYAGTTGLVLDSTSAMHKGRILEAVDRLESGGSTNGSGGLQQAYDVAQAHFLKGGTNRVILCTDGDWNVGVTTTGGLVGMIEEKRKTGVFLSVFGFGMGNLRDEMMVKLAGAGNGNYGYIDTVREAHKALVEQLGGTLVAVAKDVKLQVEFNPAAVKAYRLLGYEKRALAAKDFADDTKDAGEMGAGHVVTALYELVPAHESAPPAGEALRYQPAPEAAKAAPAAPPAKEAFLVKMRHKKPDGDVSTLRELPVPNATVGYKEASEDFRFAAAAAQFALLLRDSPYKGNATWGNVLELAEGAMKYDPSGYRAEFVDLARKAKELSGRP